MQPIEPDSSILNLTDQSRLARLAHLTHLTQYIDHTCLRPDAVHRDFEQLCEEAVEYGFASVCVPPAMVKISSGLLYGSDVKVCTVVGFPLGYVTSATKEAETLEAVNSGATEIDMVINISSAKEGDFVAVGKDIETVVRAASDSASIVKVIIECCYLTDLEKRQLVDVVAKSGAAYIKTSTGFGSTGATLSDVKLLVEESRGRISVKAAGGIKSAESFLAYIDAGAKRIGLSQSIAIMQQLQSPQSIQER